MGSPSGNGIDFPWLGERRRTIVVRTGNPRRKAEAGDDIVASGVKVKSGMLNQPIEGTGNDS